ncbi:MAG: hypothetical protein KIT84_14605 [Labilithrix sp.]|nr:hypothetical protein [Labilithrix sp.]MCW5812253.1 hypothetical protein [Labilithrix sp.]
MQPSTPQTLQAAQAAERQKYYVAKKTFTSGSGGVTIGEAYCNNAFDIPVTGGCTAPDNSGARLTVSRPGSNLSNPSLPFNWTCGFFNTSAAAQVEAHVVCKRP